MKSKRAAFACALSFGALLGMAQGQGLLSIGHNTQDFEQDDIPLTWTVSGNVGWDSNINSVGDGVPGIDEEESLYLQAGIGVQWSGGSRVTRYTLGASASLLYYFDDVTATGNDENVFYSARIQGSVVHQASRRLTISDSFYVTYEYEPDQYIGAATSSRTEQYFYAYNNFALSYAWTRRFSTVANYAVSAIIYDDLDNEDRINHQLGLQGRYAWTRQTTLVGEYRFRATDYDRGGDYVSHYALVGVDHAFSKFTTGSLRVGAEFRSYDDSIFDDSTNPYVEASLVQRLNEGFSLRWAFRYGLEDSELGGFESRESFRTGVTAVYDFNPRLQGTASVSYVHSEFQDSIFAGVSDSDEDYIGLQLGLSYLLYSNVRLNGNYSFTTLDSDSAFRDYDRHRISVGASATF